MRFTRRGDFMIGTGFLRRVPLSVLCPRRRGLGFWGTSVLLPFVISKGRNCNKLKDFFMVCCRCFKVRGLLSRQLHQLRASHCWPHISQLFRLWNDQNGALGSYFQVTISWAV